MADSLTKHLAEFSKEIDDLPATTEPPRTTLQILRKQRAEDSWKRLLFYFLSPDKSHGLGNGLLEYLLSSLAERADFDYTHSQFNLRNTQVRTEVTVDRNNRRVDAIIWCEGEFFICWELKIDASETNDQTTAYVRADEFKTIGLNKDTIPSNNHHYIYLTPKESSPPTSATFVQIDWTWVARRLEEWLKSNYGNYPTQTTAQINGLTKTIKRELTETEKQANRENKAELFLKYYDEINAVEQAKNAD